ncbi:MAG: 8-oxo-dGTP diphosphatase [Pseudomonadota bacterium]
MRVSDIDWPNWEPEQTATLMFVQQESEVLLIRKKRGLGAGKINGPGGRIEPGETPMDCAIRETQEELLITPRDVAPAGELFFHAEDDMPKIHGHVFVARGFDGEPTETDEAIPIWLPIGALPFEEMWEDDKLWLPHVLAGKHIMGWFTFEGERMLDHRVDVSARPHAG